MCIVCIANNINQKHVHVPKYTHFSDYWLRTSAVIHVYKVISKIVRKIKMLCAKYLSGQYRSLLLLLSIEADGGFPVFEK